VFDGLDARARWTVSAWRRIVVIAGLLPVCGYGQTLSRPPALFVDRDACPGECCTYGSWRAERATTLYATPSVAAKVVGRVEAGSVVDALTGEVHTKAGKFVVRKASEPYRAGDVIWVYTYLGEGGYRVWRAGKMAVEEISVQPGHENPDDWGHFERVPVSTWWIHLRGPDGREGWTNASSHFSGTHSCG
jgi:hypothetical protein